MSSSGVGQIDASGFGGGGASSSSSSKHLLEIEVVGLKRRLWAAESKQECRRWVRSRSTWRVQEHRTGWCCRVVAVRVTAVVVGRRLLRCNRCLLAAVAGFLPASTSRLTSRVMPLLFAGLVVRCCCLFAVGVLLI